MTPVRPVVYILTLRLGTKHSHALRTLAAARETSVSQALRDILRAEAERTGAWPK